MFRKVLIWAWQALKVWGKREKKEKVQLGFEPSSIRTLELSSGPLSHMERQ